jgi:hypothetical protein
LLLLASFDQAQTPQEVLTMEAVSRKLDVRASEPADSREWLEGRLHYIEHALESLLNVSQVRCPVCGETVGLKPLTDNPTSLCLICERNSGLNASFHTP